MGLDPTQEIIFIVFGLFMLVLSPFLFLSPKKFLWSRKAQRWVQRLGEEKTCLIIKFISAPLSLLLGGGLAAVGIYSKFFLQ